MGWLKEELQERGIRAKACYSAIEVSQPTWNKIEEDPTLLTAKQIQKLARLLRCTPEDFFKRILFFEDIANS